MSGHSMSGAAIACKNTRTRESLRQEFLFSTAYADWSIEALTADASFRRYFRLTQAGENLLLMDSPPESEDIDSYLKIDDYLLSIGLRAPQILVADPINGFAIIEDFGADTYTALLDRGHDARALYQLAVDALKRLHLGLSTSVLNLPRYDDGFYEQEAALFIDWYWVARTGAKATARQRDEFLSIWESLLSQVSTERECMVLRDYHVDNLMLIGDSNDASPLDLNRCGLLDFQDALIGSRAYDLVSLLQDARREVDPMMADELLNDYLNTEAFEYSETQRQAFLSEYRILAAHRHAKVIGIFVRLCVRDGKAHYLNYLPHVQKLMTQSLQAPELAPLAQWLDRQHPGRVDDRLNFDVNDVRTLLNL
jgi:N-acetylmuramate 1-kinase